MALIAVVTSMGCCHVTYKSRVNGLQLEPSKMPLRKLETTLARGQRHVRILSIHPDVVPPREELPTHGSALEALHNLKWPYS